MYIELVMDYKVLAGVFGVLCIVLAAYALVGGGGVKTVVVNSTIYPVAGLNVIYLYPLRCVDCDLTVPGSCDYCTSYYDDRLMDLISQEVGAPVEFFVSDTVNKPSVLVASDGRVTLGDARTRYNIASTLCSFAGVQKSCEFVSSELGRISECISKYGVSDTTLIYHTSSTNCPVCKQTDGYADDLAKLEYNDTLKYSVKVVDHADKTQSKILTECMSSFDNIDYAPQLLCPANGFDLTGEFTLSQAREFADKCIESA